MKLIVINLKQSFGSQGWDASLSIQALLATDLTEEIGATLMKGHEFIKASQVVRTLKKTFLNFFLLDCLIINYCFRLKIILLENLRACIDIFQKGHGLFQIKIMDGKVQTLLLKH